VNRDQRVDKIRPGLNSYRIGIGQPQGYLVFHIFRRNDSRGYFRRSEVSNLVSRMALVVVAIALALPPAASPCSISTDGDVPFNHEHFALYGEVVDHVSIDYPDCGEESRSEDGQGQCPPAWGIAVKILESVQIPARGIKQVEFYDFGFDSMCGDDPAPRKAVENRYPVGTRVKIVAQPFKVPLLDPQRVLLRSLGPTITSISLIPSDQDVHKLANSVFDYAAHYRRMALADISWQRNETIAFELWRDKLRLTRTHSEREAFRHLLRMGAAGDLGDFAEDGHDSPIEKLAAQYLPTLSLRQELAREVRNARYDTGELDGEERLEVARQRAEAGDPRGMFEYGLLLDWKPTSDRTRRPQDEIDAWIRRSAAAGFLPAISEWLDRTDRLPAEDPVRREALAWYRAGEASALRAARRHDPTAYLFLTDLYSTRVQEALDQDEPSVKATREKAERYSCLLADHPDGGYWRYFATSAWWYVECPRGAQTERK
jgi:hypothetical protein